MDKFIRSKEVISGQIQDEIVMMDIGKGNKNPGLIKIDDQFI